ncbi:MAG: DUF3078 domain-containing protein [Bacteroidales bacterium]
MLILFSLHFTVFSQIKEVTTLTTTRIDTISLKGIEPELLLEYSTIKFSKDEALSYLRNVRNPSFWKNPDDPFRKYLDQLIHLSLNDREKDVKQYLTDYPYDSIKIPRSEFYLWDTLRIRFPEGHTTDSVAINIVERALAERDATEKSKAFDKSKILVSIGDNLLIQGDTLLLVLVDTLRGVGSGRSSFPFRGYDHPMTGDSIQAAIGELVRFLEDRDSSLLMLTGSASVETPFMLNTKGYELVRFWLSNEYNDSVTVWVGSPSYNTVGLYLENNIMFRRPVRASTMADAKVNVPVIDNRALKEVEKIYVKPNYWRYTTEISSVLNQALLSNWVKGGESNISTNVDITMNLNYLNTPKKMLWYNQGRLKHGFIASKDKGARRNMDLIELNSKLNHKAFGKFDFSTTAVFKTQLAKGYSYPKDKDPVLVSRIMSPSNLTLGIGLDYKPNRETSFNVSPLSYKWTYVADTANIPTSRYSIPEGRKSRHEPGASVVINHKRTVFEKVSLNNKIQLFTNYINKPKNVDIDWEMIATMSLNWFTDIRINTHLIYDDDTKTTVYDKDTGDAVLGSDGEPLKTARVQFKEIIGFSFIFRF